MKSPGVHCTEDAPGRAETWATARLRPPANEPQVAESETSGRTNDTLASTCGRAPQKPRTELPHSETTLSRSGIWTSQR